jgi:hypothetical protein
LNQKTPCSSNLLNAYIISLDFRIAPRKPENNFEDTQEIWGFRSEIR